MIRVYITATDPEAPREWFDRNRAQIWTGRTEFDGQNRVSVNVGQGGQQLFRTAGGRWVLNTWSAYQGIPETYEWASDEQAHEWLLFNEHDEAAAEHFGPAAEERGPGRPEIGQRVCVRLGEHFDPLDAYAAEHGMSRADAVRYAVMQMLDRANA